MKDVEVGFVDVSVYVRLFDKFVFVVVIVISVFLIGVFLFIDDVVGKDVNCGVLF